MWKIKMLEILKSLFDAIFAYSENTYLKKAAAYTIVQIDALLANYYTKTEADAKFATKDSVYDKTAADARFTKLADPVDADTLEGKSLEIIEAERNLAILNVKNQLLAELAKDVKASYAIGFNNGDARTLQLDVAALTGGNMSLVDDGKYLFTYTSQSGSTLLAEATVTMPNGSTISVTNNDWISVTIFNGQITDTYFRNDTTNVAINSLLQAVNSKANQTFLESEILRVIGLIDGKDLSAYYTKTEIDEKFAAESAVRDEKDFTPTLNTVYTLANVSSIFTPSGKGVYIANVVSSTANNLAEFEIDGTMYKHGDRVKVYYSGTAFTSSEKLNTHFEFELTALKTELMNYVNTVLGN
jgi:hypothetical protein